MLPNKNTCFKYFECIAELSGQTKYTSYAKLFKQIGEFDINASVDPKKLFDKDVDYYNYPVYTPLQAACINKNHKLSLSYVKELLSLGAAINPSNDSPHPFALSILNGCDYNVFKTLVEYDKGDTIMFMGIVLLITLNTKIKSIGSEVIYNEKEHKEYCERCEKIRELIRNKFESY